MTSFNLTEKLSRLDGRFAGSEVFKYRLKITGYRSDRISRFIELRTWCWESWGPSCERDLFLDHYYDNNKTLFNKYWAWQSNDPNDCFYIYFIDDGAAGYYKLKWT